METKIQGNKLTVTTTPDTQYMVGQIVVLMHGRLDGGKLRISITGPQNVDRGNPVTFQITVTNIGKVPLNSVILQAQFDDGLEHETKNRPLNLAIGPLAPQETQKRTLILTAVQAGRFKTAISATSDGVKDHAEHIVKVKDSK